jgi:RNA polymerase sigma factor (sigma-70 family)
LEALALTPDERATPDGAAEAAVSRLPGFHPAAYRLAFRIAGSSEAAGDAVQQAYLEAIARLRSGGPPPADECAWFLGVVFTTAKKGLRAEARRRRREAVAMSAMQAPAGAAPAELVAALRTALADLDEELRLPVALCCEEGLTHRQAAEVLGVPHATLSRRVEEGLGELRRALGRAGYAAAPAAVAGALAHTAPPVPAGLAAAAGRIVSLEAAVKGTGATADSAALKGGIIVKVGLGIAAAGLVAGGVALLGSGFRVPGSGLGAQPGTGNRPLDLARGPELVEGEPGTATASSPATEKKPKFDIPVWHPDARWEVPKESFANNTSLPGILDGPRREAMQFSVTRPHLLGGFVGSGRYVFESYDARNERFHPATRGARGYLDGPFSRARFSYGDYHDDHMNVRARDGRFYYIVAGWWTGHIRALDFEKQTVTTLPVKGCAVSADGESGRIYVVYGLNPVTGVTVLSPAPEWKVLETRPLQGNQGVNALGFVLAVDEKRGRLYGRTAYPNNPWYVWYWDLKDGSYHGLLPIAPKDEPGTRGQGEAGPFKGVKLYGHGELGWGPDDPEKRYLYLANVDDGALYRMDLDKEVLMVMNKEGRFVDRGKGIMAAYSRMPLWFEDGSFVGSHGTFPGVYVTAFRRVK